MNTRSYTLTDKDSIDYKRLNALTIKDRTLLLLIIELKDCL
ncbi:uncharacterized protein FFFS_15201 [Fusarium fujikuroi]|nr:uncharacterized protein FFFS_15201 [Fusarium fujikuroi]